MKKNKKLVGLLFSTAVLLSVISINLGRASAAQGFTAAQIQNATYTLTSTKTIKAVIGGQTVIFTSNTSPLDASGFVYYVPPTNVFCTNYPGAPSVPGGIFGDKSNAISVDGGAGGVGIINDNPLEVRATIALASGGTTAQNCQAPVAQRNKDIKFSGSSAPIPTGLNNLTNLKAGTYAFGGNGTVIVATYPNVTNPVTFTDKQPEDGTHNFAVLKDNPFCKGVKGLNFNSSDWEKATITLTVKLAYQDPNDNNSCKDTGSLTFKLPNPNKIATKILQWNGTTIETISDTESISLDPQAGSSTDGKLYLATPDAACGGGNAVILDAKAGNAGTFFGGVRQSSNATGALGKYLECGSSFSEKVLLAGTYDGTPDAPLTAKDDTSDCVANSHTSLEWILCPITTSISKGVDAIDKLITAQLTFDVDSNLADKGEIHTAWSIIKNIATILIIILMLVMVFSQAIGGTLFDAYTVRKLLPRLVIAVIAMQLSWEICKYLITLANHAGLGIRQILTAPFGAGGDVDLNSILHRLNPGWSLASQAIIPVLLVSVGVLAFVSLGGSLVIAFGLFIGVFMALMMLLFRNVLIVALTIFSPVAFLLWVLPGQGMQKYWKMWTDNFSKLLMLFPLVIAIIYSGRIFAWVIAGTNHGPTDGGLPSTQKGFPGFIDYITILVAYFGPYFIIFKAYKWGGGIYSAAGNAVAKGRQGIIKANSGWLNTMGERAQGNLADRYSVAERRTRELENRVNALNESGRNKTPAQQRRLANAQKELERLKSPVGFKKIGKVPIFPTRISRPSRDWMKNAAYRIGAGTPLPTERQKVETLAKAGTYKKDLVDKKQALMHTDYVEELNRTGSVGGAKEYIERKYGIENYEVDDQGRRTTKAKDKYTERAFFNWTIDTASWMELGDEDWRMGAHKGKLKAEEFLPGGRFSKLNRAVGTPLEQREAQKLAGKDWVLGYASDPTLSTEDIILNGAKPKFDIAKTPGFAGMMNADPNRYRAVAEKLPLLQPFHSETGGGPKPPDFVPAITNGGVVVQNGGNKADPKLTVDVQDYLDNTAAGGTVGKHYDVALNPANDPARAQQLAQQRADRLSVLAAEDARYSRWLRNLEHPTDLGQVRAEHYNLMREMVDGLGEAGVSSQSAVALKSMMDELAQSNSVEGRSIMQRLMGGEKSARDAIDGMFGHGYLEDKLGVRVRIPSSVELEESPVINPEVKQRYAREVLKVTGVNSHGQPVLSADAVDLVKSVAADYDTRVILNKDTGTTQQWQLITELREAASKDRDLSNVFNALIDEMTTTIQSRVEGVVRQAASEGMTGDRLARVRETAVRLANAQIQRYQSIKVDPVVYSAPLPDGTLIVHPTHAPAPPGAPPPASAPTPPVWSNPHGPLPPSK